MRVRLRSVLIATILCAGLALAVAVSVHAAGDDVAVGSGSAQDALTTSTTLSTAVVGQGDLESFLQLLGQKGVSAARGTVVSGSTPEVEITAQSPDDRYGAIVILSRVLHEAALAKAEGRLAASIVDVKLVDATGATQVEARPAIDPIAVPSPRREVTEEAAAATVRDYLTTGGSGRFGDMMSGLTIEGVAVASDTQERTLTLDLRSDGSDAAKGSLTVVVRAAAVSGGWVSELNASEGLGLTWVRVHVSYPGGAYPDLLAIIDPARQSIDAWQGGRPPDFSHRPSGD